MPRSIFIKINTIQKTVKSIQNAIFIEKQALHFGFCPKIRNFVSSKPKPESFHAATPAHRGRTRPASEGGWNIP